MSSKKRPDTLSVEAPAKINLDLRVCGSRSDGFHELRTVFQSISLSDTLTCTVRPGPFELRCEAPGVPPGPDNLVWRAATELWQVLGRRGPVKDVSLTLDKRIPTAAGLGGGSSDAAATLRLLAQVWGGARQPDALLGVATTLGSDVPYFLSGGTALGLGRGEELYPLVDFPRLAVVLVIPPFGVSTVDAYRWLDEDGGPKPVRAGFYHPGWPATIPLMQNDLEAPVSRRHPAIRTIGRALGRGGALSVAMSGSGSAVFGLFESRRLAAVAGRALQGRGWRIILSTLMGRAEFASRITPRGAVRLDTP